MKPQISQQLHMGRACPSLLESLALWLIYQPGLQNSWLRAGWPHRPVPGALTVGAVRKDNDFRLRHPGFYP